MARSTRRRRERTPRRAGGPALGGLAAWAAGAALVALATGCPGRLEDPTRFRSAPQETTEPEGCSLDVVQDLLLPRCAGGGCHGADAPAAGLDLASPDRAARLVDAPASQCDGEVRIDSAAPGESYFVRKLEGPVEGCGERMPLIGAPLTSRELQCVRRWAREITGGTPRDAGAPMAPVDAGTEGM